jgi:hypothetical protein
MGIAAVGGGSLVKWSLMAGTSLLALLGLSVSARADVVTVLSDRVAGSGSFTAPDSAVYDIFALGGQGGGNLTGGGRGGYGAQVGGQIFLTAGQTLQLLIGGPGAYASGTGGGGGGGGTFVIGASNTTLLVAGGGGGAGGFGYANGGFGQQAAHGTSGTAGSGGNAGSGGSAGAGGQAGTVAGAGGGGGGLSGNGTALGGSGNGGAGAGFGNGGTGGAAGGSGSNGYAGAGGIGGGGGGGYSATGGGGGGGGGFSGGGGAGGYGGGLGGGGGGGGASYINPLLTVLADNPNANIGNGYVLIKEEPAATPEPATLGLVGTGIGALLTARRKRRT